MVRLVNALMAVGLGTLLVIGVVTWWPERPHFPSDMRDSALEIQRSGVLRAASLAPAGADVSGERAAGELARRLGASLRWEPLAASDALRRLEADSLDLVVHFDEALPASEAYGLTRPYRQAGAARLVLAVPAGENRLLQEADRAVASVAAP
jgi:hypothetical protein